MSVSNYTYFGPVIKVKEGINIISKANICSNKNCFNNKIKNNLNEKSKFCSECGGKIEHIDIKKPLGRFISVVELSYVIKDILKYEDYIECPEAKENTLILTRDNIKNNGFYMDANDFNFKIIPEDFNIKEKIDNFNNEIKENGLSKVLDENLGKNSYQIIYAILNFGDC